MTPQETHRLSVTSWFMGNMVDILLQGFVFAQAAFYFGNYSDDRIALRLSVAGLVILTMLKTIHSVVSIWIHGTRFYGDFGPLATYEWHAKWLVSAPILISVTSYYVQMFFCYRLYVLSRKKKWIVIPIVIILTFALVSSLVSTSFIVRAETGPVTSSRWFGFSAGATCVGDLIICYLLINFLRKAKAIMLTAGIRTTAKISAIIRLSWLSIMPATAGSIIGLVISQQKTNSTLVLLFAFYFPLAKIYALSMMVAVNYRLQDDDDGRLAENEYELGSTDFAQRIVLTSIGPE